MVAGTVLKRLRETVRAFEGRHWKYHEYDSLSQFGGDGVSFFRRHLGYFINICGSLRRRQLR